MVEQRLLSIIEKAENGTRLTREEVIYLLGFEDHSYESGLIRAAADMLVRRKNDNAGIIIGQIGTDIHPCEANCRFCAFAKDTTCMPTFKVNHDTIAQTIRDFTREDDLYGLYLMTMADTDKDYLLDAIAFARSQAPATTQIWINTGDNDRKFYEEAKAAGAFGAYHVCRVGEGKDTRLDPKMRIASMKAIREAGLELYSCAEPIGPEHTAEEIADAMLLCVDLGVTQFGAMRRVAVPGSYFGNMGQISNLRMAYLVAVTGLIYASCPETRFFGVHEPCESGYLSGANFVTAETGANPRDTMQDTSKGRGWDMQRCRKLLYECGFTSLLKGDQTRVTLDYDYLVKTDSLI